MATRVLNFSRAHPDPSPGYTTALSSLEEGLARAQQLADRQKEGIAGARAANAHKRLLRRRMRRTQLVHLVRVARGASKEAPGLAQKFVLRPEVVAYQSFRTAARTMTAEALNQKELLVRHGLADTVLESLVQNLKLFEQAMEQGTEARRLHVGASAELDAVADEVVHIVRVMDALNRFRFAENPEAFAEWASASNIIGPPRPNGGKPATPNEPAAGGEVRPAA